MKERLPVVARINKEGLKEKIVEISGMSRHDAENGINGLVMALGIWLQGIIRDIPEDTAAVCIIEGLGKFSVRYHKQANKPSAWRDRDQLPQRPKKITLEYTPSNLLARALKQANEPIRKRYLDEYRPAVKALKERLRIKKEQEANAAQDPSSIRQSIMDEIAELEGKSPYWHGRQPVVILPVAVPAPWDADSGTQIIIPEIMPAEDNRQRFPPLTSMDKTQIKYFTEHPEEEKGDSAEPASQEEILKAQYKAGKLAEDPGAFLFTGPEDRKPAIPLADQGIESFDTLDAVQKQIERLKALKA